MRRNRLLFGSVVLAILLTIPVTWTLWLHSKLAGVTPGSRPGVRSILTELVWGQFTGGRWNWQDELAIQSHHIVKLPLGDRLSFDVAVLLNCPLHGGPAT